MKIWCAAGVNLTGGRTKDGGDIVGASVFYSAPPPEEHKAEEEDEISRLDAELKEGASLGLEAAEADQQLSSLVWICTSTQAISKVTVIDANSPADVLESFQVCSSHLLCIASVPGAKESDYRVDEELNRLIVEESEIKEEEAQLEKRMSDAAASREGGESPVAAAADVDGLGTISFISCGDKEASQAIFEPAEPGKKVERF